MAAAQVHAAIAALYGADPVAQKNANDFLVAFALTNDAWEVSIALTRSDDPSVQYFGANMLHGKVKSDFASLPATHRASFATAVAARLDDLASRGPASALAARRMCLALACASTRAGAEAATATTNRAMALASCASADASKMTLALEIAAAIAEETRELDRATRVECVCALVPRIVEVLGLSERILDAAARDASLAGLRGAALRAALAWLRLDEDNVGGCALSPGQLSRCRAGLLRGAVDALRVDVASDAAVEFLSAVLSPGAVGDDALDESNALRAIIGGLCAQRDAMMAGEEGEDLARAVCRVAVAVSEKDAGALARPDAPAECLNLTDLVLCAAEAHARPVMEAAADYFLMLNTVSVSSRHPSLGEPLFKRLVGACVRRATLPADFTTWDAAEEDEDTFGRFREQILADVLDNCYGMIRSRCLLEIGGALASARSWQDAEAAVFAARAVAAPLRTTLKQTTLGRSNRGGGAAGQVAFGGAATTRDPSEVADEAETHAFLSQLFQRVGEAGVAANAGDFAGGGAFTSHPLVVASTSRMIGAYAAWLGQSREGQAMAQGAVTYLLGALRVPEAFAHASAAFRNVLARCAARFNSVAAATALMDAANERTPARPPPASSSSSSSGGGGDDDDRAAIVEGIARVIASMSDANVAADAGRRLAEPPLRRAVAHAAGGGSDANASLLAAELSLLASAVRFLEFPAIAEAEAANHPAMAVVSHAWPTLSTFAGDPWRGVPKVQNALCDVYTRAVLCAKRSAKPLLPHVLAALKDAFTASPSANARCLDVLAVIVEVFSVGGSSGAFAAARDPGGVVTSAAPASATSDDGVARVADPSVAEALSSALLTASQTAHSTLSASPLSDNADLARATFELARAFALHAPAILLTSPALPPLAEMAAAALSTLERDAVRAAVAFLSVIIAPGDKASASATWSRGKGAVDAFASTRGEAVVAAVVAAGADTCPRHLLRPTAQLLHAMRGAYGAIVDQWIASVVLSNPAGGFPNAPGVEPLDGATLRTFCELASSNRLPPQRWTALVVDFWLVCRKEATADALLAHQM